MLYPPMWFIRGHPMPLNNIQRVKGYFHPDECMLLEKWLVYVCMAETHTTHRELRSQYTAPYVTGPPPFSPTPRRGVSWDTVLIVYFRSVDTLLYTNKGLERKSGMQWRVRYQSSRRPGGINGDVTCFMRTVQLRNGCK